MSDDPHLAMPHEPAPPEPRWRKPEAAMLLRGSALGGLAVGAGWLGIAGIQRSWLLAPVSACLGATALLAAWAAAIHLTGGEKFDDHPFI